MKKLIAVKEFLKNMEHILLSILFSSAYLCLTMLLVKLTAMFLVQAIKIIGG